MRSPPQKPRVYIERFTRAETQPKIPRCPVCNSPAELWEYQEFRNGPILHFVGCSHNKKLLHQSSRASPGCLLTTVHDEFYKPTARAAITYWTNYRKDLLSLRRDNSLQAVEDL